MKYYDLDIFGSEDRIGVTGKFSGIHTGQLLEISATNHEISGSHCEIYKLEDGLIKTIEIFNDSLSLFIRLGRAVLKDNNPKQIQSYLAQLKELGIIAN